MGLAGRTEIEGDHLQRGQASGVRTGVCVWTVGGTCGRVGWAMPNYVNVIIAGGMDGVQAV